MKFFKRIFAGPGDVGEAVTAATGLVDKFTFTKEERAGADLKVMDWTLKYLAATQPQNLARRYIAFSIVGLWVFLVLLAVLARPFAPDYSDFIFTVLADLVAIPFGGIMAFYFMTHLARSYRKE